MATQRQVGLDPLLDGAEPKLAQPADLALGERVVGEVGKWFPAPERERLAQRCGRLLGLTRGERPPALLDEPLEAIDVQFARRDFEDVTVRTSADDFLPRRRSATRQRCVECLAQARDVDLNVLRGARRCLLSPHDVDQPIDGNHLVPLQQQHRQDDPLLAPAELNRAALAVVDLERPEYPEVHRPPGIEATTKRASRQSRAQAVNASARRRYAARLQPRGGASGRSIAHSGRQAGGTDVKRRNHRVSPLFVAAVIAGALAAPVTAAAGSGEPASQNAETSNAILRNDIAHYGNQPVSALGAPSAQRQSPAAVVVRVDGGFDWVSARCRRSRRFRTAARGRRRCVRHLASPAPRRGPDVGGAEGRSVTCSRPIACLASSARRNSCATLSAFMPAEPSRAAAFCLGGEVGSHPPSATAPSDCCSGLGARRPAPPRSHHGLSSTRSLARPESARADSGRAPCLTGAWSLAPTVVRGLGLLLSSAAGGRLTAVLSAR